MKFLLSKGADVHAKDSFGRTPLFDAMPRGSTEVISLLLENGADVNARDRFGQTPLHHTVMAQKSPGVKALLEAGADVNNKDDYGNTPLFSIHDDRGIEVLKLLVAAGADINAINEDGTTILDMFSDLDPQCAGNKMKVADYLNGIGAKHGQPQRSSPPPLLIDEGPEEPSTSPEKPSTIQEAAQAGDIASVSAFLKAGVPIDSTEDYSGSTALHEAALYGQTEMVRFLLSKGANPQAKEISRFDTTGKTPLFSAAMHAHPEVVQILIDHGADARAKTSEDRTPLHYVAGYNRNLVSIVMGSTLSADDEASQKKLEEQIEWLQSDQGIRDASQVIQILLAHGAELNAKDDKGVTPLQIAAEHGEKDIARLLHSLGSEVSFLDVVRMGDKEKVSQMLDANPALLQERGEWGFTPLHVALHARNREMAVFLIEKGADVNAKAAGDATPLHCALWEGANEAIPDLIKAGADVNAKTKDAHDPSFLWTPLQILAAGGSHVPPDIVQLFLEAGAEYTIYDVAMLGDVGRVKELITKDPSLVNSKAKFYGTPLSSAASAGQAKVVEALLVAGADVNQSDGGGSTALQQAVFEGHTEVVKVLLSHGAKTDVADPLTGGTLLELATERGFKEIAEMLREAEGKGK